MGIEILTVSIIAGVFLIALVIYLFLKPKGEAAGTEASPAEEFSLQASPGNGAGYKLWLRYDINWVGREHAYGLTFDLDMAIDGQNCFKGQLRTGSQAVTEEDRARIKDNLRAGIKKLPEGVISPTRVKCSRGRSGGICYERATIAIARTGPRRPGSLITVIGKVTPAEGTSVNSLYFFLAR